MRSDYERAVEWQNEAIKLARGLDAAEARVQQLEEALRAADACYDAINEAIKQDAAMGYPMPGDSCLAAALGLVVDETWAEVIKPALVVPLPPDSKEGT